MDPACEIVSMRWVSTLTASNSCAQALCWGGPCPAVCRTFLSKDSWFSSLEGIYFLVPGSRLAVLPLAFCLADGQPGHKGEFMAGLGKRAGPGEERGLGYRKGDALALASLSPLCPGGWGLNSGSWGFPPAGGERALRRGKEKQCSGKNRSNR